MENKIYVIMNNTNYVISHVYQLVLSANGYSRLDIMNARMENA